MHLGLGIDTGGTYTDSVFYDFETDKVIARAKALTTKEDLLVGIMNSLGKLPDKYMEDVELVALSTTLATNACVEGKGSNGKLVLLGYDGELVKKLGSKYGLPDFDDIIMIPGSHGQQGQIVEEPDWEKLKELVLAHRFDMDAFGVSEYWGIRNSAYEQEAKRLIREWTGLPVVCAHELSGEINSFRRASTVLLNARLIPLINELIKAVKISLKQRGVSAPIMIVRGDGTLMSENFAVERPVETLLSGPAASVVGGMKLSENKDCIIIDMGGTTSDLTLVRDGFATLVEEGVDIGGWRTGTRAIEIKTVGLGGDSLISFNQYQKITIGPRRGTPLSWMAQQWPEIKDELIRILKENKWHSLSLAEFFFLVGNGTDSKDLTVEEKKIIDALKDGPKSLEGLAKVLQTPPYFLKTSRLESLGLVARAGMTPTDFMHITGEFRKWDADAAIMGGEILAERLELTMDQLISQVKESIEKSLYMLIAQHLLERDWKKTGAIFGEDALRIIEMGFYASTYELAARFTTSLPIVGIGAPIHVFLERVAAALGTRAVITEDADVANAVGAITGSIIGQEDVLIKPHYEVSGITGYGCHSSRSYFETEDYQEALRWAEEEARKAALEKAQVMGACDVEVDISITENSASVEGAKDGLLLETLVVARGIGKTQHLVYS